MKKWIIGTLAAAMALSVVGCKATEKMPEVEIPPVVNPAENEIRETEIKLRIGNVTLNPEDKNLSYQLHNDGDNLIEYGLSYIIERKEGENWVNTGLTDNMAVIMIMMMIEPGKPAEDSFNLSEFEFEEGQYRILRQYRDEDSVYDGVISFNVDEKNEISLWESYVSGHQELSVPEKDDNSLTLPVEPPMGETLDESKGN